MIALVKEGVMAVEPLPIAPIGDTRTRSTIAMQAYRALREAIVTMRLLPGNPLSEAEVARQMGISRQPVREAFIKLSEIGLVDIVPQRGTYVVKISARDVDNARFMREAIEVAIVRRACEMAGPRDVARIEQMIAAQVEAAEASDQERFLKFDDAFHQAVASSGDCLFGWGIIEDLKAQMDRVRFLSLPEATPMEKLIAQHRGIATAIAECDPDAAGEAMREHLSEILKSLPALAEAHTELFSDAERAPLGV
jgi:DNA-binding GntR family transcriptional regulator